MDIRLTRRHALRATGVTAAAAAGLGGAPASAASAGGRIDTHHHAVPDAIRQWGISRGLLPPEGGPSWAYWTEEAALRLMADNQIAAAVVTTSARTA